MVEDTNTLVMAVMEDDLMEAMEDPVMEDMEDMEDMVHGE
jgi:hypothetical protein